MISERSLITLNTSHHVSGGKYEFTFGTPAEFLNSTISVYSFALYNSIFNVKSGYNNNKFKITWIDGTNYNITIPDGYYTIENIGTFIEQQCLLNGLYVTKDDGNKDVFFYNLTTNSTMYKAQLDVYYIPTQSLATDLGYEKPSNASWNWPTQNTTPQIEFSSGLLKMFGMTKQTVFPTSPTTTDQSFLSDVAPRVLPVFSILVTCNFCDSKLNPNPQLLTQIPIKSGFGELIDVSSTMMASLPVKPYKFKSIIIELLDQEYNPLEINDTDFSIVLLIETKIPDPKINKNM